MAHSIFQIRFKSLEICSLDMVVSWVSQLQGVGAATPSANCGQYDRPDGGQYNRPDSDRPDSDCGQYDRPDGDRGESDRRA